MLKYPSVTTKELSFIDEVESKFEDDSAHRASTLTASHTATREVLE
jgi:hypothetical protein